MQIDVHGQHIEVTDALRSYSEDKMTRLERHFDLEGLGVSAFQLMMTLAGSVRLQASAGAVDLRAASTSTVRTSRRKWACSPAESAVACTWPRH